MRNIPDLLLNIQHSNLISAIHCFIGMLLFPVAQSTVIYINLIEGGKVRSQAELGLGSNARVSSNIQLVNYKCFKFTK